MDRSNHQTPSERTEIFSMDPSNFKSSAQGFQSDTWEAVRLNAPQVRPSLAPTASAVNLPDDLSNEPLHGEPQALLEAAWFGAEFKKHRPRKSKAKGPGYGTGAFSVQGPEYTSLPELVPARPSYATGTLRLDALVAAEHTKRYTAVLKESQLFRNGLAVTNAHGALVPLLAYPTTLTDKAAAKRREAGAKLLEKYDYESSGDEAEDILMGREPKEKVRFARLKEALSKLEQPPAVQAAEPATG
jgi:hypothetical protein